MGSLQRHFGSSHLCRLSISHTPQSMGVYGVLAYVFVTVPISMASHCDVSDVDETNSFELLQRSLEIDTPLQRRSRASPMFYLHIMKCGTSFYNVVAHLPLTCPGLPGNVSIGDEAIWGKCFESAFKKKCFELCDTKLMRCDWPPKTHWFITDELYQEHKGRFVALFRQPEQRLLSQYYDNNELFRAKPHFISACSNETMTDEFSMEEFIVQWGSRWACFKCVFFSLSLICRD